MDVQHPLSWVAILRFLKLLIWDVCTEGGLEAKMQKHKSPHTHKHLSHQPGKHPSIFSTADCELLSNAGFHWQVLWSRISIALVSVAEVMGQSCLSRAAKLWREAFESATLWRSAFRQKHGGEKVPGSLEILFSIPESRHPCCLTDDPSLCLWTSTHCQASGHWFWIAKKHTVTKAWSKTRHVKRFDLPQPEQKILLLYPIKTPAGQSMNGNTRERERDFTLL